MAKMSDKTKRAINKGRRNAGLKPIKFGATKKSKKISLAQARRLKEIEKTFGKQVKGYPLRIKGKPSKAEKWWNNLSKKEKENEYRNN